MLECVILFSHHKNDELTRHHLNVLRAANPFYPVLPICRERDGKRNALQDAHNVWTQDTADQIGWAHCDIQVHEWFKQRPLSAHRYIVIEYDVYAPMPVRDFYGPLWDADCVGINVWRKPAHSDKWVWFKDIGKLPEQWQEEAVGIDPCAVMLFSHRCMDAMSRLPIPRDVFCELRIGSMVKAAGFQVMQHPYGSERISCSILRNVVESQPSLGIYHPVKDYLFNVVCRDHPTVHVQHPTQFSASTEKS